MQLDIEFALRPLYLDELRLPCWHHAGVFPAIRASRVQPSIAIKQE